MRGFAGFILLLSFWSEAIGASSGRIWSRTWGATELFRSGTSAHMVLDSGKITLERNLLVEDDAPGCGYSSNPSSIEILSDSVMLKKILLIDRVPSRVAYLAAMFYPDNPPEPNNGRHVIFTVNGHDITWEVRHFWTSAPVPAEYLKVGENDIRVRVLEPGTRFKTWIALDENFKVGSTSRLHHPNRSARSTDGGRSWDDRHLGVNGNADGEYSIRLNLESYQEEGWLESAVIDLAENSNLDALELPVDIRNVALGVATVTPPGTSVGLEVRTGSTLSPAEGGWSPWHPSNGRLTGPRITGRFLQFRQRCRSSASDRSPAITGATITSTYDTLAADAFSGYTAVASKRFPVIRSSFPFEYERPGFKGLQDFRAAMKLDRIVEGAGSEFEVMLRIKGWVARQWKWHLLKPEEDIIEWDARRIMTPGADGNVEGGFCLHYAIVLMQALQSFGFPARVVSVDYSVWGGHEVVEAWSNQYGKWVFLDANLDTYFTDRSTGVPLSVLEMHNVFVKACFGTGAMDRDAWSREDLLRRAKACWGSMPVTGVVGGNADSGTLRSYEWWNPPLNLSAYCGGYGPLVMGYLRYMPRANYLSAPLPIPLNHGRTHWGWTGYYCWYDPQTPRSLEHSTFTDRETDLYWNLNEIDFRALVVNPGSIRVAMATNSPDFGHYELIVNGNVMRQASPTFDVHLLAGKNTVEMRIVDSMGNKGAVSSLTCTYNPGRSAPR